MKNVTNLKFMKLFTKTQIRELDRLTIENEPISSIDLMERTADKICRQVVSMFYYDATFLVIAGPGNNGGDALAATRILLQKGYRAQCILLHTGKLSPDCELNFQRLRTLYPHAIAEQTDRFEAPTTESATVIIDGLFGSGLSRTLTGIYAEAVQWINSTGYDVAAIDIPSGLGADEIGENLKEGLIVKATITMILQFPKLTFLLPETGDFVGLWAMIDIGIDPEAIKNTSTGWHLIESEDIKVFQKAISKFSHKGTFGHALIVAGSRGMAGASILASKAALKSGTGMVTVHGPECNRIIVQVANPEVIFDSDVQENIISQIPDTEKYQAVAIGPGIGTSTITAKALADFLSKQSKPCVLDADALNLISKQPELIAKIPQNSILTPHPKEFDRMFGPCNSTLERIHKASKIAQKHQWIIVLKGAYTATTLANGEVYFNSSGTYGMATAGSGDVLTGIIAGFMAQGFTSTEAALRAVFVHGKAGNLALNIETEQTLIASDIIANLNNAFVEIHDVDRFR